MSTYRIYVDSRDRQPGGRPEDFTYALPYTLNITEKSLANIDCVCLQNSMQTVIPGKRHYLIPRKQHAKHSMARASSFKYRLLQHRKFGHRNSQGHE